MWAQPQGYVHSWEGGSQPPSDLPSQSVDPTEWADKAAQWAQQKHVVEQQQQQLQQQQQQYVQQSNYQQQPHLYQDHSEEQHYQDQQLQQQPLLYHEEQHMYAPDPNMAMQSFHQPQSMQIESWPQQHQPEMWPQQQPQEMWFQQQQEEAWQHQHQFEQQHHIQLQREQQNISGPKQGQPIPGPQPGQSGPQQGQPAPGPQPRHPMPGLQPGQPTPGPQPGQPTPGPQPRHPMPGPQPGQPTPGPQPGQPTPGPQPRHPMPGPQPGQPTPGPQPRQPTPGPQPRHPMPGSQPGQPTPGPQPRQPTPGPQPGQLSGPQPRQPTPGPQPRQPMFRKRTSLMELQSQLMQPPLPKAPLIPNQTSAQAPRLPLPPSIPPQGYSGGPKLQQNTFPANLSPSTVAMAAAPSDKPKPLFPKTPLVHCQEKIYLKPVPVDPKPLLVDPKPVPVNSKPVSVNSKPVPVNSKPVPVNSKPVPVNSKPVPVNSKQVPVNSKQVPVNSKQVPVNSKQVPVNSKPVPVNSKPVPVNSKRVLVNAKPVPVESKHRVVDSKPVPVPPKQVSIDSNLIPDNPLSVPVQVQHKKEQGDVPVDRTLTKASLPSPPKSTQSVQNAASSELAERMQKFKERLEKMQSETPVVNKSGDGSRGSVDSSKDSVENVWEEEFEQGDWSRDGLMQRGREGNFDHGRAGFTRTKRMLNPDFFRGGFARNRGTRRGDRLRGVRGAKGMGVSRGTGHMNQDPLFYSEPEPPYPHVGKYGPGEGGYEHKVEGYGSEEDCGFGDEYYNQNYEDGRDQEGYEDYDEGVVYSCEDVDGQGDYYQYYEEGDEREGTSNGKREGMDYPRNRKVDGIAREQEVDRKETGKHDRDTRGRDTRDLDLKRGRDTRDVENDRDRIRDHQDLRHDRDIRGRHEARGDLDRRDDLETRPRRLSGDRDLRDRDRDQRDRDRDPRDRDRDPRDRDQDTRDRDRDQRDRDQDQRDRDRDPRDRDQDTRDRDRDQRDRDQDQRDRDQDQRDRDRDQRDRDQRDDWDMKSDRDSRHHHRDTRSDRYMRDRCDARGDFDRRDRRGIRDVHWGRRDRDIRNHEMRDRDSRDRDSRDRDEYHRQYRDKSPTEKTGQDRERGYKQVTVIDYGHVGTGVRQENSAHGESESDVRCDRDGEGDGGVVKVGHFPPPEADYTTPSSYPGETKRPSQVKATTAATVFDTSISPNLQMDGKNTVIPGLESAETTEQRMAKINQEEHDLKGILKSQILELFGELKGDKMVNSLDRVVNQLQTLKGLETSLKSLQGRDFGANKGSSVIDDAAATEEARKQVAALLATEGDSDGESDSPPPADVESYANLHQPMHRILEEDKPAVSGVGYREFDGTYNVKPQVFGTYSTNGQSVVQPNYATESHEGGSYSSQQLPDTSGLPGLDELKRLSAYDTSGEGSLGRGEFEHIEAGSDQFRGGRFTTSYQHGNQEELGSKFSGIGGGSSNKYNIDGVSYGDSGVTVGRAHRGSPSPPLMERGGRSCDRPKYGGELPPLHGGEGGDFPRYGDRRDESQWDQRQGYQSVPPPSRRPDPLMVDESAFHHATPMDIEPDEEDKGNISQKLETIDYSHGATPFLASGRIGLSAIQTVDYHHGQVVDHPDQLSSMRSMADSFGSPVPSLAAAVPPMGVPVTADYGGFPAYSNYADYPLAGSVSYPGQVPAAGAFFSGLDPAAIFAAYNEQTGGEIKPKGLPKWLKEELEKIDMKKRKALGQEEQGKTRQREGSKRPTWREEIEADEERERERREEKIKTSSKKSRFYRYSESASDSDVINEPVKKRRKVSEREDPEEKKMKMMVNLRKMLTEILLEVTNQEIRDIAMEVYEDEKKIRFVFKEPKIKPKRALKPNVLAALNMYESSSDSDEEKERGSSTTGAKILTKPSRSFTEAISKAFESTSIEPQLGKTRKKVSMWDVTQPGSLSGSSSTKSPDRLKGSKLRGRTSSSRSGARKSSSKSSRSPSSSSRRRSSNRSDSVKSSSSKSRSSSRRHSRSPSQRTKSRSGATVGKVEVVPLTNLSGVSPTVGGGGSGSVYGKFT